LSNRESAMRSLQKKAEHAARLKTEERTQRDIVAARCEALVQAVEAATAVRKAMDVTDTGRASLAASVDECLRRCQEAIEQEAGGSGNSDAGSENKLETKDAAER
jgi:hypothetical protein